MSDGDLEKEKGNAAFRKEDYATALKHYDKAIEDAGDCATAALFSNKAAALQKLKKYDLCIQQCLKGLSAPGLTPEVKSKLYFRKALAYEAQGKFEEAIEAVEMCEFSPTVLEKLNELICQLSDSNPEASLAFLNKLLQRTRAEGSNTDVLESMMERLTVDMSAKQRRLEGGKRRQPKKRGGNNNKASSNRAELIAEHSRNFKIYKEYTLKSYTDMSVRFDTLNSGDASGHFSTALHCDLKSITIDKLQPDEVSAGKLLICRTIAEPYMFVGALTTLIEDPAGEAARLAIYNLRSPTDDISSLLPPGTYLAIKEPWFKNGAAHGELAVRVDNPGNLLYLEQTNDLLKNVKWRNVAAGFASSSSVSGQETWESFEKRANKMFVAGNYELAASAYTDAIELKRKVAPEEEVADLLANRAAAYLGDGKPTDAFWDCTSALYVKPGHLKATIRLAKAQAKLSKYEEAKDVILKSPHTTKPEFKNEISRLDRLIHEQETGAYDLKSLLKEAGASKTPRLDHADHNGGVAVQLISQEKGKGLVAQRDFTPGDLLFVSKAFEAAYKSECNSVSESFRGDQAAVNDVFHNECVSRIIRRISKDKDLIKEVYQLSAGPNFGRLEDMDTDSALAVDAKRVSAIVNLNAFCSNDFGVELSSSVRAKYRLAAGTGFAFNGCGVWILASFMNHSCVPNTVMFYVGGLMFVRAAKPIRKGEELTTSYAYVAHSYTKRQEALLKYRFKCDCELCKRDLKRARDKPDLERKREAVMASFKVIVDDPVSSKAVENTRLLAEKLVCQVMFEKLNQEAAMKSFRASADFSVAWKVADDISALAEKFMNGLSYQDRCDLYLQMMWEKAGIVSNILTQWPQAAMAFDIAYMAAIEFGTQSTDKPSFNSLFSEAISLCFSIANSCLMGGGEDARLEMYLAKLKLAAFICWGSEEEEELLTMLYPEVPVEGYFNYLRRSKAGM